MMCKKELKTVNIASPNQKEAIKRAELQMMQIAVLVVE